MNNIHIYIGSDDFLISETVRKYLGKDVGLEVIDSRNSNSEEPRLHDISQAAMSLATPPFLEPRKVTWWKNVGFLPGGGTSKKGNSEGGERAVSAAVKEALARFIEQLEKSQLPENQHFIVSGPHLLKTSVVAKRLLSFAEVVTFGDGKPWEVARQVESRVAELAAERKLKFKDGAAALFVAKVGYDTRSIVNELDKLREFLGEKERLVTAEAINAITSPGVGAEPMLWDLTDAIGQRNLEKALAVTATLEGSNGFVVVFTTVIERFFRQMIDVAAGKTAGLAPFTVRKMGEFLRNWKVNELRIARWRFLTLREKVVSGLEESKDNLAVTELVRVMRR